MRSATPIDRTKRAANVTPATCAGDIASIGALERLRGSLRDDLRRVGSSSRPMIEDGVTSILSAPGLNVIATRETAAPGMAGIQVRTCRQG